MKVLAGRPGSNVDSHRVNPQYSLLKKIPTASRFNATDDGFVQFKNEKSYVYI
jgi:hypothetical protein